jgi:hypothetical protein
MPSCANAQSCRSSAGAYSSQHRLHPGEPDDRIDLDVAAHRRRPRAHGQIEHPARAVADVVSGEHALGLAGEPNGIPEASRRRHQPVVEKGLVEMDVRLDEARRDQAAAQLDRLAGAVLDADADDALAGDRDVHDPVPVRQARPAQREVRRLAQRGRRVERTAMRHTTTNQRRAERVMD